MSRATEERLDHFLNALRVQARGASHASGLDQTLGVAHHFGSIAFANGSGCETNGLYRALIEVERRENGR